MLTIKMVNGDTYQVTTREALLAQTSVYPKSNTYYIDGGWGDNTEEIEEYVSDSIDQGYALRLVNLSKKVKVRTQHIVSTEHSI